MVENEMTLLMDDLGRVVIPKRIRLALDINNNRELIMCLGEDYLVIKKKKTKTTEFEDRIANFALNYYETIIFTDLNKTIYAYGKDCNKYLNLKLNKKFATKIKENYLFNNIDNYEIIFDKDNKEYLFDAFVINKNGIFKSCLICLHDKEKILKNGELEMFKNILLM